jgi:hypothetical protein
MVVDDYGMISSTMSPHAEHDMAYEASDATQARPSTPPPNVDYYYTYDNRDGSGPETLDTSQPYQVAEHILWAPRKIRVASIGAGAAGIMLCYKKEKEFEDDIELVVYDSE